MGSCTIAEYPRPEITGDNMQTVIFLLQYTLRKKHSQKKAPFLVAGVLT